MSAPARWQPAPAAVLRVRHLHRRFGLPEPAAGLVAALAYGEGRT